LAQVPKVLLLLLLEFLLSRSDAQLDAS